MAYGYYSDPGTSFGNTGQSNNETFIARQQRLKQVQQPAQPQQVKPVTTAVPKTTAGPAPVAGSTGTPVSGNGKIPEALPAQQAVPAPAAPQPAPAAPAAPSAAFIAAGSPGEGSGAGAFVQLPDGGWVPKDHPSAKQVQAAAPVATGAATTGTPGSALGGAAEAAKSGMFTQYAAPEHDFQNFQQLDLVSQLLANPETMSPAVVEQMKQKSMEEALLFQKQTDEQNARNLGSRGFSTRGGQMEAAGRRTNEAIMSAILGQNRDHEIAAASQNRQDQLQALQAAEGIIGGQVGRSSNVFNDILAGQHANRGDHWTGQQLALQEKLGVGGLNIDQQRVSNQNRQFDTGHGLNIMQFLEGQRQHNNSMGFNWAGMNANQQGNLVDRVGNIIRPGG